MAKWWEKIDVQVLIGPSYADVSYLGSGLNGAVFRANDLEHRRLVAVKLVNAAKRDRITRKRLDSEIEAMRELRGACAVEIYHADTGAQRPYYVMEYVALGDFRHRLVQAKPSSLCISRFVSACKHVMTTELHIAISSPRTSSSVGLEGQCWLTSESARSETEILAR